MFGLTEEQRQLQSAVRAFAEGEIAPHVSEWDEKSEFPHGVVKKLGEMGLLGVIFPEELGGAGMGYVEYVIAVEELSRVDGSVGINGAGVGFGCGWSANFGGQERRYLGAEWVEDFYYEWKLCGLRGCAGGDGQV